MEQYSFIKNKRRGYFGIGCSKTGRPPPQMPINNNLLSP